MENSQFLVCTIFRGFNFNFFSPKKVSGDRHGRVEVPQKFADFETQITEN